MMEQPDTSTDSADLIVADALLRAASEMLAVLGKAGFNLTDPVQLLALQLLGPVTARALGVTDLRAQSEELVSIAEQVDITRVRTLMQKGR